MYRVFLRQKGKKDRICIHNPMDSKTILTEPLLKIKANSSGSFSFGVEPDHEQYKNFHPLVTEVQVYRDKEFLFAGRVLQIREEFDGTKTVTCEGVLSYLNDTIQPVNIHPEMSISTFLRELLDSHNQKSPEDRQFRMGRVTVTGDLPKVVFTNYETTWGAITQLIQRYGGYLYLADIEEGYYVINYESYFIKRSDQVVAYSVNLLDIEGNLDAVDLATVIVPIGAELDTGFIAGTVEEQERLAKLKDETKAAKLRVESLKNVVGKDAEQKRKRAKEEYDYAVAVEKDAEKRVKDALAAEQGGSVVVKKRVGIESVNGGKSYVMDPNLYSRFGWIEKVLDLHDIKEPGRLLMAAQEELKRIVGYTQSLRVRALDVGLLDKDVENFSPYSTVTVRLKDGTHLDMPVTEMELHLLAPEQDTLVLGAQIKTGLGVVTEKITASEKSGASRIAQRVTSSESSIASQIANEAHVMRAGIDEAFAKADEAIKAEIKARNQAIKSELAPYSERMEQVEKDLDAARADITEKATALGDRASTIESRVAKAEGEIVSSAQKMDVLDGNIKATAAEIKQVPDKISAAVSEVQSRLNAVNLLLNSSFHRDANLWDTNLPAGAGVSFGNAGGYSYMRIVNNNTPARYVSQDIHRRLTKAGAYTVSGWVNIATDQGANDYRVYISISRKKNGEFNTIGNLTMADSTGNKVGKGWRFVSLSVEIDNLVGLEELWVNIYTHHAIGTLYVRDFFMAAGDVAIDGTGLSDIVRRSTIDMTPDGIVTTVGANINGRTFATMIAQNERDVAIIAEKLKVKADMIVDGAITTKKIDANAVDASKLAAGSVTARAMTVDAAMVNKLMADNLLANKICASDIFSAMVKAIDISADRITSGVLNAITINNGHMNFGKYGVFKSIGHGLQINVPESPSAKNGVGVQFIGKNAMTFSDGTYIPLGLFIYQDDDFSRSHIPPDSDAVLLTVRGYIDVKGVNNLQFYESIGPTGGTMTGFRCWKKNVGLQLGGNGNSIYYDYNNVVYDLWPAVKAYNSDRRLKCNIKRVNTSAFGIVKQLKFYSFDWRDKEKPTKHTNIGLIAQDVQKIDDSLVFENGDYLNLDTLRLTCISLKANQELAVENAKLKKKVDELEKRLSKLERMLSE